MRKVFCLLVLITLLGFTDAISQTYTTTESKSCGACGKAVSKNSKVGMTCPHCHVRWGNENTKQKTSTRYSSNDFPSYDENNFNFKSSIRITKSTVNVRSGPSTKSQILDKIQAYTTVTIISTEGDWYYVQYSSFENYKLEQHKGYIYSQLLD